MFARVSVALPAVMTLAIAGAAAEIPVQPFPLDWSEAERSVVDLSRWLDAPAGKDGPLRVAGGHLVRPDGTRFRAWGVNAPFAVCFVSKELAPRIAQDFARLGFNCVRFHHLDVPWGANIFDPKFDDTQHLNPETLDRLDFLIAELKKRGIYFTLTLNVHREFKPGDEVAQREQLGIGKPVFYFDPQVQRLYLDFARQLLTHRNPYTGCEYRHEPALAWIELLNENSLVEAWAQWRLMVPKQRATPTHLVADSRRLRAATDRSLEPMAGAARHGGATPRLGGRFGRRPAIPCRAATRTIGRRTAAANTTWPNCGSIGSWSGPFSNGHGT